MNILIDVGHPAHVHYYRNISVSLQKKGHRVYWAAKDIKIIRQLLDYYELDYFLLPSKKDGLFNKILRQIEYDLKVWRLCKRCRIEIALGTSVSIAHISVLTSLKSVLFDDDDDDVQPFFTKFVNPFADTLLSPEALKGKRRRNDTIYYPGFHELAYLHPNHFKPDLEVLNEVGIKSAEEFFILRFNVFRAHHDIGINGLSLHQKLHLVEILKPFGRVFITTERNIEPELNKYQLKIPPEKMHSMMAFSNMLIGDSQTMTAEAAVLGIPSLRCNSFAGRLATLEELEHKYGLTYSYKPTEFEQMVKQLRKLLEMQDLKEEWQIRRQKLLADKIDVTAFWTWFIDKYPESVRLVRDEPDFWEQFK